MVSEFTIEEICSVILERRVTKPWPVPGTNFVMPKDSMVTVPITQMAVDPKYYETPQMFNPDHFSPESVSKRGPYVDGKKRYFNKMQFEM